MNDDSPTLQELALVERVTRLNDGARSCAQVVIAYADQCGVDRDTVLRAVIKRLEDALCR